MILKLSFTFFLLIVKSFAITVLVSKESINFEEKIDPKKLMMQNVDKITKACEPLKLSDLQNNEYVSSHYINKDKIICLEDLKTYKDESITFNFGGLTIVKKGKIIYENDEFIRIKNLDGTIEQIYKDGRLK